MIWRFCVRRTSYRFKSNMSKTSTKTSKTNKKAITSPDVYKPVGPYSQAVLTDKTLYVSGVLGLDTQSNMICGVEGQTRQALNNLKSILEAGESSLQGVLKTTILLTSMDDFPCVNKVYAEFFSEVYPARSTFQVVKLPLNALIEIEAIALIGIKEQNCPCSR